MRRFALLVTRQHFPKGVFHVFKNCAYEMAQIITNINEGVVSSIGWQKPTT